MVAQTALKTGYDVALRKESVDRNAWHIYHVGAGRVALRKESVDRNLTFLFRLMLSAVALRKESVDRNVRIMNVSSG